MEPFIFKVKYNYISTILVKLGDSKIFFLETLEKKNVLINYNDIAELFITVNYFIGAILNIKIKRLSLFCF